MRGFILMAGFTAVLMPDGSIRNCYDRQSTMQAIICEGGKSQGGYGTANEPPPNEGDKVVLTCGTITFGKAYSSS